MADGTLRRETNTFNISTANDCILRALATYHYLTAEQVTRLLYARSSLTTAQTHLKALTDRGYCLRRPLPLPIHAGSAAYVYLLGPKGRSYAARLGLDVPARFRPSDIPHPSHLAHAIACSDIYLCAALLSRRVPSVTFERLVPERVLRAQKERVQVDGVNRLVVPDGWLSLLAKRNGRRVRYPLVLEVDLHTERQMKWRAKVRGLLAWADGPYATLFGTQCGTVAVICPGSERRARTLSVWTATELTMLERQHDSARFLFTGENPAIIAPERLFLDAVWYQPFAPNPVPCIDKEDIGG